MDQPSHALHMITSFAENTHIFQNQRIPLHANLETFVPENIIGRFAQEEEHHQHHHHHDENGHSHHHHHEHEHHQHHHQHHSEDHFQKDDKPANKHRRGFLRTLVKTGSKTVGRR